MATLSSYKEDLDVEKDVYYAITTLFKHLSRFDIKDIVECNKGDPILLYFWIDNDILNRYLFCGVKAEGEGDSMRHCNNYRESVCLHQSNN